MSDVTSILRSVEPYVIAITFVATYIAEHVLPERKNFSDYKHDLVNLFFGIINLSVAVVAGIYLQKLLVYTSSKSIGLLYLLPDVTWLRVVAGFILLDVFMYWWHRGNHQINFLWKFHRFHHQDQKLNTTSSVRFHTVEIMLSYVLKFSLFPILGLSVPVVILYAIIFFPVVVFHHSNIGVSAKLDKLCRKLFVSPGMHRIHHSKIVTETNSNYGSVFPYWDNLFRTYKSKAAKDIEFGVE